MKWLRYLIALTLLIGVVWFADIRAIIDAFSHVTITVLVGFFFISLVLVAVSSMKWQLFLKRLAGDAPSLWQLIKLYFVGYFVNGFLPSYVGGDVARSYYVGKSLGHYEAAAATVLERYTGLIALVALGCITGMVSSKISLALEGMMIVLFLGVVLATTFLLLVDIPRLVKRVPYLTKFQHQTEKIQRSLKSGLSHRILLFKAFLLSFLFHLVAGLNVMVAGIAVGWDAPPFFDIIAVLPFILLIGAIPVLPQGLGIQEGAFFFFLQLVGATPAQAVGAALLLRGKTVVLAFVGWVLWLRMPKVKG